MLERALSAGAMTMSWAAKRSTIRTSCWPQRLRFLLTAQLILMAPALTVHDNELGGQKEHNQNSCCHSRSKDETASDFYQTVEAAL